MHKLLTSLAIIFSFGSVAAEHKPEFCNNDEYLLGLLSSNQSFVIIATHLETQYSVWADDAMSYIEGGLQANPEILKGVGESSMSKLEPALDDLTTQYDNYTGACQQEIQTFLSIQTQELKNFHYGLLAQIDSQ